MQQAKWQRTTSQVPINITADTKPYFEHWSPLFRHSNSLCKVARLVYIMPSQQGEMVTQELQWHNIHNSLNTLINFWDLHTAVHICMDSGWTTTGCAYHPHRSALNMAKKHIKPAHRYMHHIATHTIAATQRALTMTPVSSTGPFTWSICMCSPV